MIPEQPVQEITAEEMEAGFVTLLNAFIAHRKHGGILLPTVLIAHNCFDNALVVTGLKKLPPEPHIIGQIKR
jgi:hypothetical protein